MAFAGVIILAVLWAASGLEWFVWPFVKYKLKAYKYRVRTNKELIKEYLKIADKLETLQPSLSYVDKMVPSVQIDAYRAKARNLQKKIGNK